MVKTHKEGRTEGWSAVPNHKLEYRWQVKPTDLPR